MKRFLICNHGKRNGWADKLASHNNDVDGEKKFLIPLFMSILFSSYPRGMRKSKDRMNEDLITEYY